MLNLIRNDTVVKKILICSTVDLTVNFMKPVSRPIHSSQRRKRLVCFYLRLPLHKFWRQKKSDILCKI